MSPADLKSEDEQIEAEINAFLEAHPKCGEFEKIFEFLRGMDISHDVAADVAKSLLWAESRAKRPNAGRFEPKFSAEDFLALFPDKQAGASATGLAREAQEALGMSKSRFYQMLREHSDCGTITRTPAGLWRKAK
jgi:hypothetical protein